MNQKTKTTLLFAIITSLVLAAALGQAHEIENKLTLAQDSMQTSLKLNAGWASTLGLGGLSVGYSPIKNLELEVGVGFGFTGIQISFMPRLSFGSAMHRFVTGAGISLGVNVVSQEQLRDWDQTRTTLWANFDLVGYELRLQNGFVLSIAAGATLGLAGRLDTAIDTNHDVHNMLGVIAPQARIGIGYRF